MKIIRLGIYSLILMLGGCDGHPNQKLKSQISGEVSGPVQRDASWIDVYDVGDGVKCYRGHPQTLQCVKVSP
jgi:hypothetical protein